MRIELPDKTFKARNRSDQSCPRRKKTRRMDVDVLYVDLGALDLVQPVLGRRCFRPQRGKKWLDQTGNRRGFTPDSSLTMFRAGECTPYRRCERLVQNAPCRFKQIVAGVFPSLRGSPYRKMGTRLVAGFRGLLNADHFPSASSCGPTGAHLTKGRSRPVAIRDWQ
jgi:hypothetical protein